MTYLDNEMYIDETPLPNPSKAPEQVTDTEDMTNPRLMMRSAIAPI